MLVGRNGVLAEPDGCPQSLLSFSSLQAIPGIVLCLNTLCAAISGSWQVLFLSMGSLTTHLCMVSFACHLCLPGCHLLTILIRNRSPLSPNPVCFVYPIVLCTFISFFFSSSKRVGNEEICCIHQRTMCSSHSRISKSICHLGDLTNSWYKWFRCGLL
jgi:hypothetical protein